MDLESRGIPGAFIASEEFIEAAEAQAESLGYDPIKLFVPHPIQDRTDEEMQQLAESCFEAVVELVSDKESK